MCAMKNIEYETRCKIASILIQYEKKEILYTEFENQIMELFKIKNHSE